MPRDGWHHPTLAMESTRLLLTGDDFGRSAAVNEAIERAYEGGLLTQASLMVHETGVEEAVRIARRHPGLCVGLHLTLCAGTRGAVSPLTDGEGRFPRTPGRAGLRYALDPRAREPLRAEIHRQFEAFGALGFAPSYWDGHAHLHLHPTLLRLTLPIARGLGFRFVRLVREPGPPALIPWIFQRLSQAAVPRLRAAGIGHPDQLRGLRATGRMTNATFARLLEGLPPGLHEIYFHPGAEPEPPDFARLTDAIREHGLYLTSASKHRSSTLVSGA